MRICLISHEYEPFPGGGIGTYTDAASRELAARGHEVHVVTNRATYGSKELEHAVPLWRDGNRTVHRLALFDRNKVPNPQRRFLETNPRSYPRPDSIWAFTASNLGAAHIADYVASLHATVGLDVVEVPEYFAEAFYIERRRRSGRRAEFPPVCIIGHTSSRQLLQVSRLVNELGRTPQREMMAREDYCIEHADALQTPSASLMGRYRTQFGESTSDLKLVLPYYLDVAEAAELPPQRLRGLRYLTAVGRIEPRKGSDVLLRAFARVADEHPDLRLAYFGREAWRAGESFAHIVEDTLTEEQRKRVLFLGNRARADVLASVRESTAFVHAAPWDNYPNSVLEAMGVGATCVVSDSGGHAEMVEHESSGLVFPAGDVDALTNELRRVLNDGELARRLSEGAKRRVASITEADSITETKLAFFESIVAREREVLAREAEPVMIPGLGVPRARIDGPGIVVIDADGADARCIGATVESVRDQLLGQSGWTVHVLTGRDQELEVPDGWMRFGFLSPAPWLEASDETPVCFVRAGVRFDRDGLNHVVRAAREHPTRAGSFPWLRTANVERFPYAQDSGSEELLVEGAAVQAAFCAPAARLRAFGDLAGLETARARICALMAASARLAGAAFVHSGAVEGDYYGPIDTVDPEVQDRALGWLQLLGLAPPHLLSGHCKSIKVVKGANRVDPGLLAEVKALREIRDQHERLKNHRAVRWLRKLGVFSLLRRVSPKASSIVGDGKPGRV